MTTTTPKDIQTLLKTAEKVRKSFKNNPAKAKKWLIEVGILTPNGKKLAARYR